MSNDNKPKSKKIVKHQESPRDKQVNRASKTDGKSGYKFGVQRNNRKDKK